MTSWTGKQIIIVNIVYLKYISNISRSKANHKVMKFGQLTQYNVRNVFIGKSCRKSSSRKLVPDFFLLFKKAFYEVKARG